MPEYSMKSIDAHYFPKFNNPVPPQMREQMLTKRIPINDYDKKHLTNKLKLPLVTKKEEESDDEVQQVEMVERIQ